jgi:hypothetical protein
MKVDLIHKVDHDNLVWDVLSKRKKTQSISTCEPNIVPTCVLKHKKIRAENSLSLDSQVDATQRDAAGDRLMVVKVK